MSIIKVQDLTFAYPGSYDNVFENVDFQIDSNWKLGLIGRNGKGKTTLLKLLMGEYEYTGKILHSVEFDYFPYPIQDKSLLTHAVFEQICPACEEWEMHRELSLLAVRPDVLYRPFATLSNGEQTKILLAALFLNKGRFLLIDEPTNHLDADARASVAKYLRRKKGFILVSHDRAFLDACVDHILSINKADIEVQSGNFSSFYENFKRVQDSETAKNEKLQKDIKRLRRASEQTAAWSDRVEKSKTGAADKGYVGHKAAKMMKRSKSIETRQKRALEEKQKLLKNAENQERLKILPLEYRSDKIAEFSDVCVYRNGKIICGPVSFTINKGDRIALCGKNGSGKSSLLKLLAGQTIEHSGKMTTGSGMILSYVPQDASGVQGSLRDLARKGGIEESLLKTLLSKLGLHKIQFEKDMQNLSDGQKKKVLLAKSLCERAHLYIWDEPLNFIDIYSRIQLEELINSASPTIVFAEHDKTFRNAIGAKTIEL